MSERPPSYVVESGDTLSAIAERFYGDANLAGYLAESNGLADMNMIDVGQELSLPLTKEEFEALSAMAAAQTEQANFAREAQVAADAEASQAAAAQAAADAAAAEAAAAAKLAADQTAAASDFSNFETSVALANQTKADAEAAATKKALEYDVNDVVVRHSDGVNRGEYGVEDVRVTDSNG
jgi:LysM repeat protein